MKNYQKNPYELPENQPKKNHFSLKSTNFLHYLLLVSAKRIN